MTDEIFRRDGGWGASGTPARYDVEVRPEHIRDGRIGDAARCPIALACREAQRVGQKTDEPNPMRDARVSGGLIHWTWRGRHLAVVPPARVRDWLYRFDQGESVSPLAFTLTCYSQVET